MSRWKLKRPFKSRRKKQGRREKQPSREVQLISVGMPDSGYESSVQQFTLADASALASYLKAHKLLPRGYAFDPRRDKYHRIVTMAVELLKDPTAKPKAIARAIVILGHSPTPMAIESLESLSTSSHDQAPLAHMALQECLGMASQICSAGSSAAGGMN